jgi:hypothetical protein
MLKPLHRTSSITHPLLISQFMTRKLVCGVRVYAKKDASRGSSARSRSIAAGPRACGKKRLPNCGRRLKQGRIYFLKCVNRRAAVFSDADRSKACTLRCRPNPASFERSRRFVRHCPGRVSVLGDSLVSLVLRPAIKARARSSPQRTNSAAISAPLCAAGYSRAESSNESRWQGL